MPTPVLLLLAIAAQDTPPQATRAPAPDAAASVDPSAGDVIVTATRTPTPVDQVVPSVTVFDKPAIDRAQDLGLTELLDRAPGVTSARNGGYGTATSLRIRGAETDQTVFVVDGVKINDPASPGGGYNAGNLLIGDAARIEVLRGPQSVLWGSQAIGGVVNIVTPLPTRPLEESFDVEAGSRNTVSARAAIGGKAGPLTIRIGAQAFTTEGISAVDRNYGGVETDGYATQSVSGRAELAVTSNVTAELRGYYSNARVDLDGFYVDSNDYGTQQEFVGYAGLNAALFDGRFKNRIGYGYTTIKRDNYTPGTAQSLTFDALGRTERVEYQGSVAIVTGIDATFGVDHEHQRFRTIAPPYAPLASASADLTGGYGVVNATIGSGALAGLTLNAGIRDDHHTRYGSKTLFQGGGVWKLPTGTILRASYGEGFKAPTLYQLYSDYGNQALQPERATGWEAGAEQHLLGERVTVGATYFQRRTNGLITFVSCPFAGPLPALCYTSGTVTPRYGYYSNIQRAFAYGIEADAAVKLGALTLDGNYTWNPSEDRSPGATNGLQLARRPRHTANASASYTIHGVTAGAAVRFAGESFDNATHTTRLAPYTLVDLRGEVALTKAVALYGRVENLLDKQYETVYRYGTLGRSFYAGFRGRF